MKTKQKELIKVCLAKRINYHYGPALKQLVPYVVPYVAAKQPSEKSTFADFWFSLH